jgi:hypothetical protein
MKKSQADKKTLFSVNDSIYDQDTFIGRFEEFRATVNPLRAFYTNPRIIEMQESLK